VQTISNPAAFEKPFLPPQATSAPPPRIRSEVAQIILAGSLYSTLLRGSLSLSERHSRAVEQRYSLPPDIQHLLGYRSAPQMPAQRFLDQRAKAEQQNKRLDALSDDEFLDWFTYEKESLIRWPHPADVADPYAVIEEELNERFGALAGIPGCYLDDDYLRLKSFPPYSLIVACRVHGIPRALQIYHRADGSNFFWHSTPDATGGARARASIHIANESLSLLRGTACIVSHTIAADALAWNKSLCVVASNGLSPRRFVREIRTALPALKRVALSTQLEHLTRALREHGYTVKTFDDSTKEATSDE
jgi:hypothetical protein